MNKRHAFSSGVFAVLVSCFATNAIAFSPYFSVGGGLYNSRVNVSRGNASISSNGLSLTATGGLRFNQYISAEVNAMVNQLRVQGDYTTSDVTFVGIMPGVRVGTKILGIFYPYVGASVGPSFTTSEISVMGNSTSHTHTTLAYQARAGVILSLGGGAGIDAGVRYQNQGHLNIDGMDFGIDGNVTSFNYYITASYGF